MTMRSFKKVSMIKLEMGHWSLEDIVPGCIVEFHQSGHHYYDMNIISYKENYSEISVEIVHREFVHNNYSVVFSKKDFMYIPRAYHLWIPPNIEIKEIDWV